MSTTSFYLQLATVVQLSKHCPLVLVNLMHLHFQVTSTGLVKRNISLVLLLRFSGAVCNLKVPKFNVSSVMQQKELGQCFNGKQFNWNFNKCNYFLQRHFPSTG